ncbi:NACHT, LRR and PYD domains-containing protein 10 [Holothuria leucospilota]|uniref:NACHT, LRR and PYD domains-containing protein 10 n=1 Tax=Holothuria leucospilota TaxID=206669 RepID=A0A9Q1CFY7_HOLLE|nr:NACHT, LRR and PYD domains-containing protein 10 [Holothuria leucospilota]
MTPVPWKKSCRWTSLDLFVGSGLVITESKATRSLTNIDEKCKLQYSQILTHDRLKTETRIILEGEPGSGKTTMSSQIAYDWSKGKISDLDILIFLPLKFVNNVTLVEATKRFYFPTHDKITVHDIESFLANQDLKSCLILDGLEEYNSGNSGGITSAAEPSEVVKVMEKAKYPNCKVILTSRLDYAKDLPPCPMLRIGRFGETERNTYIEKLFVDNTDKQYAMKRFIENTPFILDLCSVPLLFVLAVHNIESMEKLKERQLHRISPFIENVVGMLCSSSDFTTQQRVSDIERSDDRATLEEFAYNGLCKGRQILSWRKDTLERNIPNLYQFIESGILVVEEGILKGKLRSVQNEKSENDLKERNKNQEKTLKEKDAVGVDESSSNSVEFEDAESSLLPQVTSAEKGSKENVSVGEPSKEESSPDFESELGDPELQKNSLGRSTKDFPLEVKFLHKVIQEWFASKHFSSMLWKSLDDNSHQERLSQVLPLIIPTDLHYILRFTCYLCPPICHLIMGFLLQNHRTGKGAIPEYIMNYVCLCYNEYKGQMDPQMKNVIAKVCKEVIVLRSDDSKILQQSKMALMRSAANAGILVKEVHFADVVSEVGEGSAKLNADVTFDVPTLNRIEVIEMSRWDQHLKEKDYRNILKLLLCSHSLKIARLHFPSHPPELNNEEGVDLATHKKTVEWIIGSGLVHTLNMDTGKWEVTFDTKRLNSSGSSKQRPAKDSRNAPMLSVESMVSNEGELLQIAGTDITLIIPPDALGKSKSSCLIQLKVIHPGSYNEASTSFCSNSSVIVELLPNNLRFQYPVELILPHCLHLKKGVEHNARIFMSHHEGDEEPRWEEATDLNFILADRTCTIWLKKFCWTKIEIDEEIVEGKWIQVYTAAEPICVPDDIAEIEVGYHVDLPGAGKILEWNKSLIVGQRKPYFFLKEGKHPLKIFLENTLSETWKYTTPDENPKEIPFQDVALSTDFTCPFILKQDTKSFDIPTCIFKASQNEKGFQLRIRPKVVPTLPSSGHSVADAHHRQHVITQDEENRRMQNLRLEESQQDTTIKQHSSNLGDTLELMEGRQNERGYETASNAVPFYRPHEASQNEIVTPQQIATYQEHRMSQNRGLTTPMPSNSFIQQTWYNQNVSVFSPFGGGYISYGLLDGNGESRGGFSVKYSLIQALARKLDPDDSLGNNWKNLADRLEFTMEDIGVFETQHQFSKTHAVIDCAIKRGKLKSLEHLKTILTEIGRCDAASVITTDSPVD